MLPVDLNCDMGEGMDNDAALMPYITAANIACGYHAGDEGTMRQTLLLAQQYGVAAGAHPSFPDRENFGRTHLACTPQQVYDWVTEQIKTLQQIATDDHIKLHHVKPHGALYNAAAQDASLAKAIAQAVKDCGNHLALYGLSGSHLISEAKTAGLKTASEAFADRTYQDNGSLTPRSQPNALIENEAMAVQQVLQMVQQQTVTTVSGKQIPIVAETICLHGDGKQAVAFAKAIQAALKEDHRFRGFDKDFTDGEKHIGF